jgi:hypothetical protein
MAHNGHLRKSFLRISFFLACLLAISGLIVRGGTRASERHREGHRRVQVAVVASDSAGRSLSYRWRSTDGAIDDVNAASTTWTLPNGPGLHFAYVLVSNGVGGYTERRIAVNTDNMGGSDDSESEGEDHEPRKLIVPPAVAQQGDYYRAIIVWGASSDTGTNGPFSANVYLPDASVTLQDTTNTNLPLYPLSGPAPTDLNGQLIVPGFPSPTDVFNINCGLPFGASFSNLLCGTDSFRFYNAPPYPLVATTDYFSFGLSVPAVSGSLMLADGTPCGTQNEFFGVHVNATATLLDAAGNSLAGPVRVNVTGFYALPAIADAASVWLQCEQAEPVQVTISNLDLVNGTDVGPATMVNTTSPTVTSMSAVRNSKPVGLFLPPPSGFPSDPFSGADQFLAFKGLDSRLGACQYYKAVGAVQDCDASGKFRDPVNFEDWKRTVKIGKYATSGATEYVATYVNKVDLNLTRNHHSISYGPNQTAAVVCNHLGPPGTTPDQLMNPSQGDIDNAVDNTLRNENLVACVAMDYGISYGVNNDQPFVRFLIFGPDGSLLPSINLDGRREKFVPGTCVVCHGGDHYAGKFPENGSGFANVGGRFLPYDVGNFEFSSKPGLTKADQEEVIYLLNQNILNAGPTQTVRDLLAGWYANGSVLNESYLPSTWVYDPNNPNQNNPYAESFYQNVIARSCRTCHAALGEQYNFDHQYEYSSNSGQEELCGFSPVFGGPVDLLRYHSMPNSLVTFNRFWLSGTSVDQSNSPSQVNIFNSYNAQVENVAQRCVPGSTP